MNMKPTLLSLFLVLLGFPLLGFSTDVEQVIDIKGNPIYTGGEYYIVPSIFGTPGGGLKLGITGNSVCPVTVLQDYSEVFRGILVKLTIPGVRTGHIYTGFPLEIEFLEKPVCAESSKWIVFVDNVIQKACVGIGGPKDHPGQQTFSGTFSIQRYLAGYKLVFCVSGTFTCLDIGSYDANSNEGGRRLNLTEHKAFDIVFIEASTYRSKLRTVV